MYRKCATEISVRHQKQVEDGLLTLMGKLPFEEITVTELCRESGVTRRVFYHLFSSKTDALHALIDHTILGMESFLPELSDQALRFFLYWKERKPLLDALSGNQLIGLLLERMVEGTAREDMDVRRWLRTDGAEHGRDVLIFGLSGIMALTYNWYLSGYRKTPEQMAALLTELTTRPLAGYGWRQE